MPRNWMVALWLLALVFYHMAWSAHKDAFATQNAFDLAEQVSIHPGIRAESPALRTAGFLRLPIPLIAFGVALSALLYTDERLRWILRGVAFLIVLRVIPPETALRTPRDLPDNDNAFQLFYLTMVGIVLILITLPFAKIFTRFWYEVQSVLCLVALIFPFIGLNRALQLWHELQLDVSLGGGAVFYGLTVVTLLLISLYHWRLKPNDPASQQDRI